MQIKTINSEKAVWDGFVASMPAATNYHRFGWKEVIERSFGHPCHYLAATDEKGTIEGILPLVQMKSRIFGNFLISVPFVNYGGLLCGNVCSERALIGEAEALRNKLSADHVELRHIGNVASSLPTKQHKVTMILQLESSIDGQWKAFDAKLRNQIRKAEKCGLEIAAGHTELLDGFYEVFARNMRDLGTPVYGRDFFANVLTCFPESTKLFAVKHERKVIAAGLASWFRDTVEIPWASSINDYKFLCPNNMLYWEAIKFSIENGFRKFDFGRSTLNEGTFNFKKQWGAEPVQLNWQYLLQEGRPLPELNPKNAKYDLAIKVWRKLPVTVTRILGPRIVRSIP